MSPEEVLLALGDEAYVEAKKEGVPPELTYTMKELKINEKAGPVSILRKNPARVDDSNMASKRRPAASSLFLGCCAVLCAVDSVPDKPLQWMQ